MYITLEQAKKHLNIDESFKDDDLYILDLITTAEDAVSVHTGKPFKDVAIDGVIPSALVQAVLLMVGNLYANRESVAYSAVNKVPYSYEYLIALYKNYDKTF